MTRRFLSIVLALCASLAAAAAIRTQVMPASYATGIGNEDAPILYVMMEVDDPADAGQLQGITFNLQGTTTLKDVLRVRFYQTADNLGLHLKDAPKTMLGTHRVKRKDAVIHMDFADGACQLRPGKNYFWLTADVSRRAREGHLINAQMLNYTLARDHSEHAFNMKAIDGHPFTGTQIFLSECLLAGLNDDQSRYWRIPAVCEGRDGRLIAVMDKRWGSNADLPNNIDVVTCYSDDKGRTWSPRQTIAGTPELGGDYGHGDPGVLYDRRTGDIIVCVVSHRGFLPSTPDDRALIKLIVSHDNGETWDAPRDITDQLYGTGCPDPVRSRWWGAFAASGAMMQTRSGRIMSVLCVCEKEEDVITNYVMYSDDDGETWKVCPDCICTSGDESKIVELSDGRLSVSTRHRGGRFFNTATVDAAGDIHFGKQQLCTDLTEPACNGDYVRYPFAPKGEESHMLLHTICHHPTDRRNVTVFLSEDEGKTWLDTYRPICPGRGGYSALTVLSDGTIGCFYEEDAPAETGYIGYNLRFVRFSMDWLRGSEGKSGAGK